MSDALQVYVSGFWPWLGITIGLGIICNMALDMCRAWIRSRKP